MPNTAIRTASFKRRGFNNVELEKWRQRTNVRRIYTITYTDTRVRVTYQ